jgi:uncharacterized protein YecE (DUF72 family)
MQMLAGTSGYSYKEWKGAFYPDKLPAAEMLRFYATRFPTVEINNTFYRMPPETTIARWAADATSQFIFSLKAPQRITHQKRLRDAESQVAEFLRRAEPLGAKLGVVLFQLPPYLRKDLDVLRSFLAALPTHPPIAFEFRHNSWQDDAVYDVLRTHGAALCVADTDKGDTPLHATSRLGYLRLRRVHYDDGELRTWAERIAAQPWDRAHIYFKHEDEALGPEFAQRFTTAWQSLHEAK